MRKGKGELVVAGDNMAAGPCGGGVGHEGKDGVGKVSDVTEEGGAGKAEGEGGGAW